jgi:hypothetical protein
MIDAATAPDAKHRDAKPPTIAGSPGKRDKRPSSSHGARFIPGTAIIVAGALIAGGLAAAALTGDRPALPQTEHRRDWTSSPLQSGRRYKSSSRLDEPARGGSSVGCCPFRDPGAQPISACGNEERFGYCLKAAVRARIPISALVVATGRGRIHRGDDH